MPGQVERITLRAVARLKRGDWITDDKLPGFMVRRPRKLALYGVKIRLAGRQRFVSIGTEAELTPDQARGEAERVRGLKRQGKDPASERDRAKRTLTVYATAKLFLAQHVRPKLRASTAAHYDEMLARLILTKFGNWRLDAVTTADVAAWHAQREDTPYQANRALGILSSLMSWAEKRGMRTGNPCAGIVRFSERPVNRYLTPAELSRILDAVDDLVAENRVSPFFAAGVKVLALTGARRGEIFGARWAWFDAERRDLVLPDSKTGPRRITLPEEAAAIIAALPRLAGSPYIFPSQKAGVPYVNFGPAWRLVLARAGVGSWRLHDLRHGFASAAVAGGAPLFTVGKLLGHARPITTQRYAHLGDDPMRAVAEAAAATIRTRAGGAGHA